MKGKLLVLTGLTGSGKDTIVEIILADKRTNFERIVTHNTRPPRPGEVEGRDYFFVDEPKFSTLIESGEMIEHVKHGSFLKGTTKGQLERVLSGANLIWRIEPSRAAFVEEYFLERFGDKKGSQINKKITKVFVSVKNTEILLKRYRAREKDACNIAEFEKRLNQDWEVFAKNKHRFEYIIENDDSAGKAAKAILALLEKKGKNRKIRKEVSHS